MTTPHPTIYPTKTPRERRKARERHDDFFYANDMVEYDPDTGLFRRKTRTKGWTKGTALLPSGYWVVALRGKNYRAHRVAWLLTHGEWPAEDIDHINGDRADNRLANLRPATATENARNARPWGEIPLKGVSRRSRGGKFQAQITVDRKRIHLGSFDTAEEAHAAYRAACERLHGNFARASCPPIPLTDGAREMTGTREAAWEGGPCRVPMWMGGYPAGHCGNKAFGPQYPRQYLAKLNARFLLDRPPHCFGPCCPAHGGPKDGEPIVFQDGYTPEGRPMWCAVMPGFINLQESPAAFHGNPVIAVAELRKLTALPPQGRAP